MVKKDEVKKAVQEQFGRNAEQYVQSQTHAKGDDLDLLVPWMQPQKNWTVLDIATGGGHVARKLAPHVGLVVATDLTRPMLEAASRANREQDVDGILYVQADAEALPFLDEAFDAVTCRIAAHHFPDPDAFVREVSRVLRPGGSFLLIDNVAPDDPDLAAFMNKIEKLRDPSHVRCLSPGEWRSLMEKHGLAGRMQRHRMKKFDFPQWAKRTSESLQQEEAVENELLQATEQQKAYLEMAVENGRVRTHQIEEWMVLYQKTRGDH
ncbi:class I SAM-dependent methyltransferase [Brevibacillus choshinensis]|uniref:Methyltransferase domain-containing protein n=1 Tax=Brevibacillus choshinensis TaxID=54911 RepID=A0ABX7FU87_BRECH|nr:class I SAM-dependent methyltransferase [Brevibacillus choshinensis]QRG69813.1 methyltransferase domain-containing protein [Brevibacillus choshinensis]